MDSFSNDIVIRFASYLSSQDLVNLSLTCRKFGSSQLHDTGSSLMEDTAHQIICNAKDHERDALPRMANQTYLELYSELEKLRAPRVFDQLIGDRISYVDNDKSHTKYTKKERNYLRPNTAICNHVMRAGRHYATFVIGGTDIHFAQIGITRPLKNWDKKRLECFDPKDRDHFDELQQERTDKWGDSTVQVCSLMASSRRLPNGNVLGLNTVLTSSWQNDGGALEQHRWDQEVAFESGDKIGMLLDVDAGTLTVYKNGRRVGIMKDGLSGILLVWSYHYTRSRYSY